MATLFDGETPVDPTTVRALVDTECPQWRDLPLSPMTTSGTEHMTYRLGADLLVRVPRNTDAEDGLLKEVEWLPLLRGRIPLETPVVEHLGRPSESFPHQWSVNRWIDGEDIAGAVLAGAIQPAWADTLADLVIGLRSVPLARVPGKVLPRGSRGGHLADRVSDLDDTTDPVAGPLDPTPIRGLVDQALDAGTPDPGPVLLHGDLIPGNLVARDGRLVGLLDLGTLTTGFPAWDLTPAWWVLDAPSREAFRRRLDVDDASWAWGRAFAAVQGLMADWYYRPRGHALAPLGARAVAEALGQ